MIPKIIHQTWKTSDVSTYSNGVGTYSQSQWKKLYPDFEYILWTDNDIQNLLKQKEFLKYKETFDTLNKKIKKIDFIRYIILNKYGGIYSDLDFIPTKRLPEKYFEYDFIGYRARRGNIKKKKQHKLTIDKGKTTAYVLGQAFFCSVPNHKGLKEIIKFIVDKKDWTAYPLKHTGPERINAIFVENDLMNSDKTLILTNQEVGNHKGTRIENKNLILVDYKSIYGCHLKRHQWN